MRAEILPWILGQSIQTIGLLLIASLVFDVIHYLLHCFAKSKFALLRAFGDLHETHHKFFDRELRFSEEWSARNLWDHVVPEFVTRTVVALAGAALFSPLAVGL